jgi:hypothetical protein
LHFTAKWGKSIRLRAGWSWVRFPTEAEIFLYVTCALKLWGSAPVQGFVSSGRAEWLKPEADHPPVPNADVAQSVQRLGHRLDVRGSIPGRDNNGFFFRHRVQTSSGAHPTFYPMGTGTLIPGANCRGEKLTTHPPLVSRLRMHGVIPPLPNTSSWGGAYLSKRYVLMVWCLVKHSDDFISVYLIFHELNSIRKVLQTKIVHLNTLSCTQFLRRTL